MCKMNHVLTKENILLELQMPSSDTSNNADDTSGNEGEIDCVVLKKIVLR